MIFQTLGRMLGLGDAQSVEGAGLSFGTRWAHDAPAWLLFGCLGLAALAVAFYARWQLGKYRRWRLALAVIRPDPEPDLAGPGRTGPGAAGHQPLPCGALVVVRRDRQHEHRRQPVRGRPRRLTQALGLKEGASKADASKGEASAAERVLSRIESVKALVERKERNLLARLEKEFRLRGFLFDRASDVRLLEMPEGFASPSDRKQFTGQLTADGQVTAIGGAMEDLARRHATGSLAGLVIFSDFNQNAGAPALEAARQLGVKVYTVGVGPADAANVAVSLQAPLVTKKDERATLVVTLTSQGLSNQQITVRVAARPIGAGEGPASPVPIGQRSVRLVDAVQTVAFPFVPDRVGQFEIERRG